jgi:hypothetical protein
MSEDGRHIGLLVEWLKLPLTQYGKQIPIMTATHFQPAHPALVLKELVTSISSLAVLPYLPPALYCSIPGQVVSILQAKYL